MYKVLFFLLMSSVAYCSPLLEVKVGYFNFTNYHLRKIYKSGGCDVQLAGTYPLWSIWNIYGAVEYAERSGHSLGGHEKTRIRVFPISLGIKAVIPFCDCVDLYGTIGPRYFFVRQRNHSDYVDKRVHQNGVGGFVGAGILYDFYDCLKLDLFGEYSFRKLHFSHHKSRVQGHDLDVSGYCVGLGLGYTF